MATTNLIKGYFKLDGSKFDEENSKIFRATSNANQLQVIAPYDTSLVADVTFLLSNGRTVEYQSLRLEGTEEVEVSPSVFETWNVWVYDVASNVLSSVSLLTSSPLYYSARFREEDPLFYGVYTDSGDLPLIAEDPTLVDGNFATVGTASLTSYEYDAVLDSWSDLGFEKPQFAQIVSTEQILLTIYPTVQGSDTNISASEIDIIRQWLTDLEQDIDNIEAKLKQTTDGAFEPTNDEAWSSDKRLYNYLWQYFQWLNQDLKTTASPEFVKVTASTIDLNNGDGAGTLTYDPDNRVAEIDYGNGVTLQVGEEMFVTAVNKSGGDLLNGVVVSLTGATGNKPQFELATNTDDTLAHNTIGVLTEDISNNAVGKITRWGLVRGLDTSSFTEGDVVYLGVSGVLTNVAPTPPTALVEIGIILVSNPSTGVLYVDIDKSHKLNRLSDVDMTGSVEDDLIIKGSGDVYEPYPVGNIKFVKTGWKPDITDIIGLDLNPVTKVFTLSTSTNTDYYIQNVKYTLEQTSPKQIDLTSIIGIGGSGAYYITLLPNGSLSASQTVWNIRDDSVCLVAEIYWNDTDEYCVNCAYEMHTYAMDSMTHYNSHFEGGTVVVNGLAVAQTPASETLDVTQGNLMDEDIVVQILNGTLGSAPFTQELAPLKAYKYYRLGASEIYREEYDTKVALLQGGNPKLNPFDGSVYSITDMQNNRYGAMWVVFTTDTEAPVQLWVGQKDADTLNNAIEENGLDSMNFGSIPVQEIRVAYRVMIQRSGGSYTIEQVDNFLTDPQSGLPQTPANSHGALSGLGDDDHTQYFNETRLALSTGAGKVGYDGSTGFIGKTNVQDALDQAKADIDDIISGSVADDSIINDKLGLDVKVGSNAQFLIDNPEYEGTNVYEVIDEVVKGSNEAAIEQTYDELHESTFGVIDPINGSPELVEALGLSLTQQVKGKFDDISDWSGTRCTLALVNVNELELTADTGGSASFLASYDFTVEENSRYFMSGEVYLPSTNTVDYNSINLGFSDQAFGNFQVAQSITPEQDVWQKMYGITAGTNAYSDGRVWLFTDDTIVDTSIGDTVKWRNVKVIPIDNTPLASKTASELNNIIDTYFENTKSIVDFSLQSIGKNNFDLSNSIIRDSGNFTIDDVNIGGVDYWKFDLILNLGTRDFNIDFKPNTQYTFTISAYEDNDADNHRVRITYTDGTSIDTYLANTVEAQYTFTSAVGKTIDFLTMRRSGNAGSSYIRKDDFQIEEGTSATTYAPYNSETISFPDTTIRSVVDVRDRIYQDNGVWKLEQNVGYDFNDVVQDKTGWSVDNDNGTTVRIYADLAADLGLETQAVGVISSLRIGSTIYPLALGSSISTGDNIQFNMLGDLLRIRVLKTNLSTLDDTGVQAYLQANDVEFIYEYDDAVYTDIDKDGGLIQENPTTLIQTELSTETTLQFNLDAQAQITTNTKNIQGTQREVDLVEDDVTALNVRVTANEVSITDLIPVTVWSGTLTVSPVESSPPTLTLDSDDFDTYNYYRIKTRSASTIEKWSDWVVASSNGDELWVNHTIAMSNAGGSSTTLYAKFERASSTTWYFYNGTTVTSGTPTSTSTGVTILEIQGRNV